MPALTDAKAAIGAVLEGVSGIRQVHYRVPGEISPPAVVVMFAPGVFLTYDSSSHSHDLQLVVRIFVSRGDEKAGQDLLDVFLDPTTSTSVYGALHEALVLDKTLGGAVETAELVGAQNLGTAPVGAVDYLGCDLVVNIGLGLS